MGGKYSNITFLIQRLNFFSALFCVTLKGKIIKLGLCAGVHLDCGVSFYPEFILDIKWQPNMVPNLPNVPKCLQNQNIKKLNTIRTAHNKMLNYLDGIH